MCKRGTCVHVVNVSMLGCTTATSGNYIYVVLYRRGRVRTSSTRPLSGHLHSCAWMHSARRKVIQRTWFGLGLELGLGLGLLLVFRVRV